jgi:hypothetical protein
MSDREQFDAAPCEGIVKGICVLLEDDKIIYAGPFKQAPDVAGKTVLLHAEDFDRLKSHVDKHRH